MDPMLRADDAKGNLSITLVHTTRTFPRDTKDESFFSHHQKLATHTNLYSMAISHLSCPKRETDITEKDNARQSEI